MSWSEYLPSVDRDAVYEAEPANEHTALDQFDAARAAATAIIESRAVGRGPYNVALNGHSNPGHVPLAGWSNDCVTVSVSQT